MLAIGMITLVLVSNCVYLLLKKARFNLVCNLPTYQRIIGFVKCFSITHNIGRLFSEPVNVEEAHDLRFLYGLRALMITGSVFVHSHTFLSVYLLSRVSIFQKERSFFEQYKMNHPLRYNFLYRSFLLVDIFFVLR